MEKLNFLNTEIAWKISSQYQLPVFVYSQEKLNYYADKFLLFPNAYWLTVRYAMKASSNMNILKTFYNKWIKIDASSGYEVLRAINAWINPKDIMLTAQEFYENLLWLLDLWIEFNACSLYQLERYGKMKPNTHVCVRINPWLGSGWTNRTNTGWVSSSFGIWHEYIPQVNEIAAKYWLIITKIHTHIWSWSDPKVWTHVAWMCLDVMKHFPQASILNLWWWFKVWRMEQDQTADLQEIGKLVQNKFEEFYHNTWRKLGLEIEPGTYLVANTASLICRIQDIVDTGSEWYKFLKVNSWMTEITRPSMYWAQHPLIVVGNSKKIEKYIVAWHCCESGDVWTPLPADPEWVNPREMNKAEIWDLLVVEWVWAYCSSMSTKNYNSYPEAAELMLMEDKSVKVIRERQNVNKIWENEKIVL